MTLLIFLEEWLASLATEDLAWLVVLNGLAPTEDGVEQHPIVPVSAHYYLQEQMRRYYTQILYRLAMYK